MHIAVDGHGRDTFRWTRATAERFCHQAIRLADMTLISGPHSEAIDTSICAIAILAESHVAVHLDADNDSRSAHLEMFSCKDFSAPLFAELCRSTFDLEDALAINLPRLELNDPRVAPRGDPRRLRDLRPQKRGFLDGWLHRMLGRSI